MGTQAQFAADPRFELFDPSLRIECHKSELAARQTVAFQKYFNNTVNDSVFRTLCNEILFSPLKCRVLCKVLSSNNAHYDCAIYYYSLLVSKWCFIAFQTFRTRMTACCNWSLRKSFWFINRWLAVYLLLGIWACSADSNPIVRPVETNKIRQFMSPHQGPSDEMADREIRLCGPELASWLIETCAVFVGTFDKVQSSDGTAPEKFHTTSLKFCVLILYFVHWLQIVHIRQPTSAAKRLAAWERCTVSVNKFAVHRKCLFNIILSTGFLDETSLGRYFSR